MADKYSEAELKKLAAQGKTFPGTTSYPTADRDDLENAIRAVGRGNADHNAIRRYIMRRAKEMGLTSMIPDNWSPDGSLKDKKSRPSGQVERRRKNGDREQRTVQSGIELRDDGNSNIVQLVGMPIVYGVDYAVTDALGSFTERMERGVVSDLLANGVDCRFMVNHGAGGSLPLARTTSGTLRLEDTPKGLRCIADVDVRSSLATDLAVAVERGDISQMSVAMRVGSDTWDTRGEHRTIHKLSALEDVSPVVFPASPTTTIAVKRSQGSRMTSADLRCEQEEARSASARFKRERIVADLERIEARRAHRGPRTGVASFDPARQAEVDALERAIQRARTWGVMEDVARLRRQLVDLRGF